MPKIILRKPRTEMGSGANRVGYHRIVEAVDTTVPNAYAFTGAILPDFFPTEVVVGAVVVERRFLHGDGDESEWSMGIVHIDGWVKWGDAYRDDDFTSFRDTVAALVVGKTIREQQQDSILKAAGRIEMRDEIRRIMREGVEGNPSIIATDIMREGVEWARRNPDAYRALVDYVNRVVTPGEG